MYVFNLLSSDVIRINLITIYSHAGYSELFIPHNTLLWDTALLFIQLMVRKAIDAQRHQ